MSVFGHKMATKNCVSRRKKPTPNRKRKDNIKNDFVSKKNVSNRLNLRFKRFLKGRQGVNTLKFNLRHF